MRKLTFIFSFILLGNFSFGQVNLVPNPSFEDTLGCPQGYPDLDTKCQDWTSFRATPDFYNNCSSVCGYYNQGGFQQPHIGEAYAGFNMYLTTLPNASEQIGVQLMSPLIIGTRYYLSFYVALAYNPLQTNVACNKIGLLLTTYQYSDLNGTFSLLDTCTIQTNAIISDTINWSRISGSFVSDSTYQYLIIGGFYDDSFLDTIQYPNIVGPYDAYYYLDDVCVSTDSLYNETWTSFNVLNYEIDQINLFPNPASDFINISSGVDLQQIQLINNLGQILFSGETNSVHYSFSIEEIPAGIYFLTVKTKKSYSTSIVSIIH